MVREITDKKEWEDFLLNCNQKTFLHSWNWGEFQKSLGNKIWRFGIFSNSEFVSTALVIKHVAQRGSFLLIPHGPIHSVHGKLEEKREILGVLIDKLRELTKQEKVDFIRISPVWPARSATAVAGGERIGENEKIFKDLGFRLRALHTHPESSWKLNIKPKEEDIFSGMRKTTRYLIKKAEHDADLEIFQSFNIKDIEVFNNLHLEVVKKQKFIPFSLEYFKKEFLSFIDDKQIVIFFAKYKGKIIAASYGIFWSKMAFYHHAALLPEYKKVPASYLLQWESIKEAKKRGCEIYDFWGYSDPVKYPKHPYSGPTLFKMGFGGYKEEYVKTQDLVITSKYWINYIVEKIRKIKRGL